MSEHPPPLLLLLYDWCNHSPMKKVFPLPSFSTSFLPVFSFQSITGCLIYSSNITTFIAQTRDPNRHFNNPTFYFFYLQLLLKHKIKINRKGEKIQCNLFVYTILMTTYLLCLIDSREEKKKGGQEVRSEERMELSGTEESRKLPRLGQHKWDTVEPQAGEKERLEVRPRCLCTWNSHQGWYFAHQFQAAIPGHQE